MGGSYDDRRSYTPSVPQWTTDLQGSLTNFFRGGDTAEMVNAYNAYGKGNAAGFISAVLKHRTLAEAIKEFPEIEYEIKFDITPEGSGAEPTIKQYLDAFQFPPTSNARFLKDSINAVAEGKNHFFGAGLEERLVVIEKGGKLYLKEKGQPLPLDTKVPYEELVVKRTEKRYEATMSQVLEKVTGEAGSGAKYTGVLRKEKGDAFILDTTSGRIFSYTITRAHRADAKIQRQLEIEYAGFITGFPEFAKNSEAQIVENMVALAKHTYMMHNNARLATGWKMTLAPTGERKYDFTRDATSKALAAPEPMLTVPAKQKARV
jgi:hypothetical protein